MILIYWLNIHSTDNCQRQNLNKEDNLSLSDKQLIVQKEVNKIFKCFNKIKVPIFYTCFSKYNIQPNQHLLLVCFFYNTILLMEIFHNNYKHIKIEH